MKLVLLIYLVVMISCVQNEGKKSNEFEKALIEHMAKEYTLIKKKTFSVATADSLRSVAFFSKNLELANLYTFKPTKQTDSEFILLTVYRYNSSDTSSEVISRLKKEKEEKFNQGFYGPLGKDFQGFSSVSNILIHLEANCDDGKNERKWMSIQNSIVAFLRNYFKEEPRNLIKPCE